MNRTGLISAVVLATGTPAFAQSFTRITVGDVVNDQSYSEGALWEDVDGTFTRVVSGDLVSNGGRSNGSAWTDIERDGDLDLFVTNGNQPVSQSNFLYRNDGSADHWLSVRCIGSQSNRSDIGTRMVVVR